MKRKASKAVGFPAFRTIGSNEWELLKLKALAVPTVTFTGISVPAGWQPPPMVEPTEVMEVEDSIGTMWDNVK